VYKLGKNWQTRAWDPVFKTAGSAPDAAMILGLFSQKILRLTLIISYIELFIFILIFFVPHFWFILITSFELADPSD
jgi:hypothetical protein